MQPHLVDATASAGSEIIPTSPDSEPRVMVTSALQSAGHPNPSAWESRLPADYATAPSAGHQMFLINRTWRLIIGEVRDQDTQDKRYCLVDGAKAEDWLRSLQGIIPWIVQHTLPLTKNSDASTSE